MAITVVKNPTGHKIIDQAVDATITNSGGDALITMAYHGLGTGDHVYITSDIDEYAGFWYVTAINSDTFKISEYNGADFVEYYQDADIEYYTTEDHVWNSIFLPIIYKLSNDKWPVNTIDTAVQIQSFADDNGYTYLTLTGDIRTGAVNAMDYVKISGNATESLNGVWQIVEVIDADHIVIDMAYDADNSLIGNTIQYYYNNYQVKVKVFAGLPVSHPWAEKKPMEELAELSFTPDENNISMFSVADYIKGKIEIKNNPTLFSMPLNLDAFTGFYISVAESHDTSDGYTLSTYESSYGVDPFTGYAVAGKLPFKNTYAGDYADYITVTGGKALWLTAQDRLLAVEDKYFDISFIKNLRGDLWVIIDKYVSDYLTVTEVIPYTDQGIGVYRIPIEANADYDSFCVRIHTPGTGPSSGAPSATLEALADWADATGVFAGDWTEGATPNTSVNGLSTEGYIAGAIATAAGYSYEFTVAIDVAGSFAVNVDIIYAILDASYNEIDTVTYNYTSYGVKTETFSLLSTSAGAYLGVRINNNSIQTKTFEIQSADYNAPAAPDDSVAAQDLTEEICIDILESCDAADGFTPTDIRLLEDGSYRILE